MKTEYQLEVISRVKKIRESRGVSQTVLARVLGISLGHIGNIESYDKPHKYTLKQLVSIGKYMGISIAEIFAPIENAKDIPLDTFTEYLIRYQEK